MNEFLSGAFIALGSIWLKDYLDGRKILQSTTRQKAVEAYGLADYLIFSLEAKRVICKNILANPNFDCSSIFKDYPDTMLDDLRKLELLIIENFYEFKQYFSDLKRILLYHARYLDNIIVNKYNGNTIITISELEEANKNFESGVITASLFLRGNLDDRYINKIPRCSSFIKKYSKKTAQFYKKHLKIADA